MKRTLICLVAAVVLGFSTAVVADEGGGLSCQQIKARIVVSDGEFQSPCQEYPGFDWCFVGSSVRGSIKGVYDVHGQWDWFIPDIRDFGFPAWEAGAEFQMNYEVIITKHGDILGESLGATDYRVPQSGTTFVTGGTGIYEDATGLLAFWTLEPETGVYKLRGEVCGPYIPIEDDDDSDSDSD